MMMINYHNGGSCEESRPRDHEYLEGDDYDEYLCYNDLMPSGSEALLPKAVYSELSVILTRTR